jgi:hypothetical protein
MNQTLPSELQRAQYLADMLHKALSISKQFKTSRVVLGNEDAEELLQLLSDSLRALKQIEEPIHEFDGSCIGHPQRSARRIVSHERTST